MSDGVKIAFEKRIRIIALNDLLPIRKVSNALKETSKYKRIAQSIAHLGLIEPLVVATQPDGKFLLLDGNMRLAAMRDQAWSEARCVVADDDEAFTYNRRVNRLATLQEHYMIVRAIDRGVSQEKLAARKPVLSRPSC